MSIHKILKYSILSKLPYDYIKKEDTYNYFNELSHHEKRKKYYDNNILDDFKKNFPSFHLNHIYHNSEGMNCMISVDHNDKDIYCVFKGTVNLFDWKKNFDILPVSISDNNDFKLHRGIYNIYTKDKFNKLILRKFSKVFNKNSQYNINIIGHSRGGIHALLMAYEINKLFPNTNVTITTFGSPFLLNKKFTQYFNNNNNFNIYSVIDKNDIVPYIPFYYSNEVGNIIVLDNNNYHKIIKDDKNNNKLNINIFNFFFGIIFNTFSLINHDIKSYVDKLINFAEYI